MIPSRLESGKAKDNARSCKVRFRVYIRDSKYHITDIDCQRYVFLGYSLCLQTTAAQLATVVRITSVTERLCFECHCRSDVVKNVYATVATEEASLLVGNF